MPPITIPEAAIFSLGVNNFSAMNNDGEIISGDLRAAAKFIADYNADKKMLILCHMPSIANRLNIKPFAAYDILEIFAFVKPASFTLPNIAGLMAACDFSVPDKSTNYPSAMRKLVIFLLQELAEYKNSDKLKPIVWAMARGGWSWAAVILLALGEDQGDTQAYDLANNKNINKNIKPSLNIWHSLKEWQDEAPLPAPGNHPIHPPETRQRLADLLKYNAEQRPTQADFASAVSGAFINPIDDNPNFILAEAGTGVGKTLGYIAPASLWAEKNQSPVWISTYTRNLQHQIDDELSRLYPDEKIKAKKVIIRKGRENYLCLLNFEDECRNNSISGNGNNSAVILGLMARWIEYSRNGDLSGGDFPSWLSDLFGYKYTRGLSDRRGECIHSLCNHYSRCFIENNIRRAKRADLIIANHALVMTQASSGTLDMSEHNNHFIFDEGHHVFDAADSAFSAHLSGQEGWEMRRWLRGHDGGNKSRAKGLKSRCQDLLGEDSGNANDTGHRALTDLLHGALFLPSEGWHDRIATGRPVGTTEEFLLAIGKLLYARENSKNNGNGHYSIESEAVDIPPEIIKLAKILIKNISDILQPLKKLQQCLKQRLDSDAKELDSQTRARIDLICRSLTYRCQLTIQSWQQMLKNLIKNTDDDFVDWLAIDRIDGRDVDIGLYRHWIDPTIPFIEQVAKPAHAIVITSATLTDGSGDIEKDWHAAEARTGAKYLNSPAIRAIVASPFDYAKQTKVFIINDVAKNDLKLLGAAYRELMLAAGGGALGLFTAISRLRIIHKNIKTPLENAGIQLYCQHVDGLNLPSLIDIFRAEVNSCLLGTDAVRDGVDVPGESLRMIIFDRVPWPRPTILHKARRQVFGKKTYDDMLCRLKLKQAFGRLIRRNDDKGVFIMLDAMLPSRLLGAFPERVEIERLGLAEAITKSKDFLSR